MSKGIEVMEICNGIFVNIKRVSISAWSGILYPYAYPN